MRTIVACRAARRKPREHRLQTKLARLTLPPQAGRPTSPRAREVSGRLYLLPPNDGPFEAVGLEVGAETTLVLRSGGRNRRLLCGDGEWRRGGAVCLS